MHTQRAWSCACKELVPQVLQAVLAVAPTQGVGDGAPVAQPAQPMPQALHVCGLLGVVPYHCLDVGYELWVVGEESWGQ